MRYMLDTNVCIRFLRGDSLSLMRKIELISPEFICISAIVKYELYYGAFKSLKVKENLLLLDRFISNYQIKDFDNLTAEIAGRIRADLDILGMPIGPNDLLIGATAIQHNCTLITHNTKEFSRINGLHIEDWEE